MVHQKLTVTKTKMIRVTEISVHFICTFLPSVLWCCWLGSRKGIRPVKKLSGAGMVIYLGEVQDCIWSRWCHSNSLSLAPVNPDWFYLSGTRYFRKRAVVVGVICTFWYTGVSCKLQLYVTLRWSDSLISRVVVAVMPNGRAGNRRSVVALAIVVHPPTGSRPREGIWAPSQWSSPTLLYNARQLYKNISMLFRFPVKDGKLSTGVNATFNASCYG